MDKGPTTRIHLQATTTQLPTNEIPERHPVAVAWDLFEQDNQELFVAGTLGRSSPGTYLRNRIKRAFLAGWDAAEQVRHPREQQDGKGEVRK